MKLYSRPKVDPSKDDKLEFKSQPLYYRSKERIGFSKRLSDKDRTLVEIPISLYYSDGYIEKEFICVKIVDHKIISIPRSNFYREWIDTNHYFFIDENSTNNISKEIKKINFYQLSELKKIICTYLDFYPAQFAADYFEGEVPILNSLYSLGRHSVSIIIDPKNLEVTTTKNIEFEYGKFIDPTFKEFSGYIVKDTNLYWEISALRIARRK